MRVVHDQPSVRSISRLILADEEADRGLGSGQLQR